MILYKIEQESKESLHLRESDSFIFGWKLNEYLHDCSSVLTSVHYCGSVYINPHYCGSASASVSCSARLIDAAMCKEKGDRVWR